MRLLRWILAAMAVVAIALFIALSVGLPEDEDSPLAATSTQSAAIGLTPTVAILAPDVELTRGVVEYVSDGDTIGVRIGNSVERVRLVGIDAPEESTNFAPDCLATDSHQFLSRLIEGRAVYLERDVNDFDQYGRLLRYVWLPKGDGYLLVNQMIVARGYAVARIYEYDDKRADELAAAEIDAIQQGIGIWGSCVSDENHGVPGAPDHWNGRSDLDCRDFSTRVNAQAFYSAMGGPERDPHNLDGDLNGLVCHSVRPTEPLE